MEFALSAEDRIHAIQPRVITGDMPPSLTADHGETSQEPGNRRLGRKTMAWHSRGGCKRSDPVAAEDNLLSTRPVKTAPDRSMSGPVDLIQRRRLHLAETRGLSTLIGPGPALIKDGNQQTCYLMLDLQPRQIIDLHLRGCPRDGPGSSAAWRSARDHHALGCHLEPEAGQQSHSFTTAMSIREIAPKLDVTGKSLAREFGLPLDVPKGKPLEKLGVAQEDLDHVAAHLVGHQSGPLKYYFFAALVLWGLVFLTRLGRPDGSPSAERRAWYPRAPYVAALLVALAACGFALGKSPNPMEGAVKVFKSMVGLYPSVWEKVAALGFFLVLAVIGNKLVCGWACPFGALQELLYSLPLFKRIKRRKVPFLLSNAIRATLFVVMLLLLFGVVGGRKGFVLYHSMNPFNLFSLDFDEPLIPITILTASVLALLVYRPFCQFICPFGLISWLAERISLARADRHKPLQRVRRASGRAPWTQPSHRVAGRLLAADCYSCARCLNVCPHDAISYSVVFAGRPQGENASAQALDA